ncbi:MAG TPA: tRNA uridine-5-carboxymethylaminomethyl(34) synthesis GTPase MnmE [Gemmatimonadaceae bacterium]|nr:tRNA uridine-5-carboxymethylaminomethyl(34) synthesis GTPase MnmE [Gemmatimonadaceae bacterium]
MEDTIVAIASPPGRGAIAVVRLSGPDALSIAKRHVRDWPGHPRVAYLCDFFDGERHLDQTLVTVFPAPHSYTGDDTVEISTHGGYVVPSSVVAALTTSGARQATAGEFTRRAVINGKLDILQAEAIGDLIDARSRAMQDTALAQLDGGLSRRLTSLRDQLLQLEALIVYDVDFPEEDDGPIPRARIEHAVKEVLNSLDTLLDTVPVGEIVREGAVVVIAGPPNVGKSSLFNALLGKSRAIVTEIPGTTRDALEAVIDGGKWPLRLVDTAGLRSTTDPVEQLGIEVSERYLAGAQVVLACAEDSESLEETVSVIRARTRATIQPVLTKADLVSNGDKVRAGGISVSAETGFGLQGLVLQIESIVDEHCGPQLPDVPMLTRARHKQALQLARSEILDFFRAWAEDKLPATVAAVHLRTATIALEELVGAVDVEDVLDRVFSSFCVGK